MANLMRLRSLHRSLMSIGRTAATLAETSNTSKIINKPVINNYCPLLSQCRAVGTSKTQKSDGTHNAATPSSSSEPNYYIEPDPSNPKKCWVSYGFDDTSQFLDRHFMHVVFFCAVTLSLVGISFILIYLPDNRYRDWAQREAFLVLREREAAGLPPIDVNIVDPAKVKLPTDEELGDTNVII